MKRMRSGRTTLIVAGGCCLFESVPTARADAFEITRHDAIASGIVQFFNGAPAVSSFNVNFPGDPNFLIAGTAPSITTNSPGVLSATISAEAESRIRFYGENAMAITAQVNTSYAPSNFGGDNPGGMAAAAIASVIEFPVPGDYLFWNADMFLRDQASFDGTFHVLFQNVTRSQTLIEFTTVVDDVPGELFGQQGDLLRLTTYMNASGVAQPGSTTQYEARLQMYFMIPEPTTLALVGAGIVLVVRPRRRAVA